MANVNKASLRQEFDSLKGQFEQLCAAGKMAQESKALFQALLALFELLMAVFMEKRTTKNTRNSSRPSSQTDKAEETATQPGTHPKGKTEHKGRSRNTPTIETVETSPVKSCQCCGKDLTATPCQDHERRTLLDIVYEKHQHHVDAEIKQCPESRASKNAHFRSISLREFWTCFSCSKASLRSDFLFRLRAKLSSVGYSSNR